MKYSDSETETAQDRHLNKPVSTTKFCVRARSLQGPLPSLRQVKTDATNNQRTRRTLHIDIRTVRGRRPAHHARTTTAAALDRGTER